MLPLRAAANASTAVSTAAILVRSVADRVTCASPSDVDCSSYAVMIDEVRSSTLPPRAAVSRAV